MGKILGIAAAITALIPGMQPIAIALTVASMVFGVAEQKRAVARQKRAAKKAWEASLQDRTITHTSTEAPDVFVYGRARVGANIVAIFTTGNIDQFKHLVCVHASHECDAIEQMWIAGKEVGPIGPGGLVTSGYFYRGKTVHAAESFKTTTFTLAYTPTGTVSAYHVSHSHDGPGYIFLPLAFTRSGRNITITGKFDTADFRVEYQYIVNTSTVRIQKHLGIPNDPADSWLRSILPNRWPSTAVLRGYCYTVITLDLNQPEFQSGIPPIEALIRGKKLYDFRTGETKWSENNALVLYDYLASEICGVSPEELPIDQFIAAANVCDEQISGLGSRYTFNGTINADDEQSDVLEKIAQSMAGGIVATTWGVWAGKYIAPVMDLHQEDIVGDFGVTPGISDADLCNGVKGQFISPENLYAPTDIKPYQNAVYRGIDGRDMWASIDFPFTNTLQRAHNLCRIHVEDQRNSYIVKGFFSMRAWPLQIGQRVTLTSDVFGWNRKIFRITDKSFSPETAVELSMKEDAPEIWDFADAVVPDATPNTSLPDRFNASKVGPLTCASGTDQLIMSHDGTIVSRILVSWPATDVDIVELEWLATGSETWQKITADGSTTSTFLSPVQDGVLYTIRARGHNVYFNARSDWTYVTHTVVGKSEPPPDVAGFYIVNDALSWVSVNVIDLQGYEIRFQYGRNDSWADAAPLHTDFVTESPWRPELMPPGELTLMIKAIDTSGNESARAAVIYHRFGDIIVDNLILEYDDRAAGFAGEKVNGSVVDGNLAADDSGSLFWGNDDARFYGSDAAKFWPQSTYKEMTYVLSYTVTHEAAGSRMTLLADVFASTHRIEYRYNTQGIFWRNDDDFFWREDDALFWPAPTEWKTWPGAIEAIEEGVIEIRITTQDGEMRGLVSELVIQFDVEDEYEELDDVVISSSGTRLPVQKKYRAIKNIQLTLQDDGGEAATAKWADKVATGPMIHCFTLAGVRTSGVIDARIQGVKG